MKIVVYTALCGPKGKVQPSDWIRPDVDYVCFTDQPYVPSPWQARPIEVTSHDPARTAKRYKVLPHRFVPGYDVNIWVDANIRITRGYDELLDLLVGNTEMVVFRHFERDCIYDEANACLAVRLDHPDIIEKQVRWMRVSGFPDHYGLAECNFLMRRNATLMEDLSERWWTEIREGSRRDQLSFMFCVWQLGLRDRVKILDRTSRDGHYHTWTPHLNMGPLLPL